MAHCRSCNADVTWARNERTGKVAPLDYLPSDDGNCVIVATLHNGDPSYRVLTKADRASRTYEGLQRFTSHFVTCPQRVQHRK